MFLNPAQLLEVTGCLSWATHPAVSKVILKKSHWNPALSHFPETHSPFFPGLKEKKKSSMKTKKITYKSNPTLEASQKTFSQVQYNMDIRLDKTQETGTLTPGQHYCCVQSQLVNKHTRLKIKTSGEWVMCNMGLLSNGLLRHEFDFRHIKCSTPLYKVQIQIKLPWESLYIFYVWHWAVRLNRLQYEILMSYEKPFSLKKQNKNTQLKLVCKHHNLQALLCDGTLCS